VQLGGQAGAAMKTNLSLIFALIFSSAELHASTMVFDASASRIIGHDSVTGIAGGPPERIWDQDKNNIQHPLHYAFDGFYTRLVTEDAFDNISGSNTGGELAHGYRTDKFGGVIAAGHQFGTLGVTSTNGNAVHLSMRGLLMDIFEPDDFLFNTSTQVEHRIYRGGTLAFFEQTSPTEFTKVLAYTDLALHFTIDYISGDIGVSLVSATPDNSGGLPTLQLTALSSNSLTPVLVSGDTLDGPYGRYASNDLSLTFASVPEPSRALLGLIGCLSVTMRRRRAQ
jgi:hypothetical protein